MKLFKKLFGAFALMIGLGMGNAAHAGIPVIDASSLAQQIQQVKVLADKLSIIRHRPNWQHWIRH